MNRKAFFNTIKNYKWQSVFAKFWIAAFITLLIPVVAVYIILTSHYNNVLNTEFQDSAYEKLMLIREETEKTFNGILINYSDIVQDEFYSLRLYSLGDKIDNETMGKNMSDIKSVLTDCVKKNSYIENVYLAVNSNNYVFSTSSTSPSDYLDSFAEKNLFYNNDGFFNYTVKYASLTENYIIFKQKVTINGNNIATVVYKINFNHLLKTIDNDENSNFEYYFSDKAGNILMSSLNSSYSETQKNSDFIKLFKEASSKVYLSSGKNTFIAATTLSSFPIMVVVKGSPHYYKAQQKYNSMVIWSITLLTFIFALAVSFIVTSKLYNYIFEIIILLQNPFANHTAENKKNNELLYIKNSIISITEKNRQIEKELAERLTMLNQAQSAALESQLNPHFLFNTLQIINLMEMSKFQGETDVTKAISLLADLLEYALDTTNHFVTLRTEIEYNKKYIKIQNLRYGDDFETIWNIDPETLDLKIMKLSIQPLLENAISHGISTLKNVKGYIVVSSELDGEFLKITVADNGKKINEDKLNEIRKKLEQVNIYKKKNIGLSNINQRMKLIFGDKYSVKIYSDETGTRVMLLFPVIKQ